LIFAAGAALIAWAAIGYVLFGALAHRGRTALALVALAGRAHAPCPASARLDLDRLGVSCLVAIGASRHRALL